jgi:hypothetical protein
MHKIDAFLHRYYLFRHSQWRWARGGKGPASVPQGEKDATRGGDPDHERHVLPDVLPRQCLRAQNLAHPDGPWRRTVIHELRPPYEW